MGKRKVGLLAQVLAIVDRLSLEEIKTLSDTVYLKLLAEKKISKSESKPERKPAQKRKAQTVSVASETVVGISDDARCGKSDCARFFDDNIHHKKLAEGYHEFVEPAGEARGATGGG